MPTDTDTAATTAEQPAKPPKKRLPKVKTKEALAKAVESVLLEFGPEIVREWANGLLAGTKAKDKAAMEMVARIFVGDRGPGGVSILNQTLNVNQVQAYKPRGTEGIIREFEERDRVNRALPEPTPIRLPSQIIDAEDV